jgi:hypothetical protein
MSYQRGDVLGLQIFSHRQQWNGAVCEDAAAWRCGAKDDFRTDHCAKGDARCHVLGAFRPTGPQFSVHVSQLEFDDPHAQLQNQLLLLWGMEAREPHGVPIRRDLSNWIVFGLYRIREVVPLWPKVWRIVPHADGWVRLSGLREVPPRYEELSPGYLRAIEPTAFRRFMQKVSEAARLPNAGIDAADLARLGHANDHLDEWLEAAAEAAGPLGKRFSLDDYAYGSSTRSGPDPRWAGLAKLRGSLPLAPTTKRAEAEPVAPAVAPPEPAVTVSAPDPEPVASPPQERPIVTELPPQAPPATVDSASLLSEASRQAIGQDYGGDIVMRLMLGTLTKAFLILRGNPGAGKSRLATMLVDDTARRHVVVVSSTWRGREDLLGYVNPVDGVFESTDLCRFLCKADDAWKAGDRAPRVVIFEEFNLSPPEFWLSEILARSQYPADAVPERTIELGGLGARGVEDKRTHLFLSPALRFVGTINNDHTTRPLSPRVLDRACIIDVPSDATRAIAMVGLSLEEDQLEAIKELDFRVRHRGATFSVRSALSLKTCLAARDGLGIDSWKAIDVVILQEVLTKVRLLAGDPSDLDLLNRLDDWARDYAQDLPHSKARVQEFRSALEAGNDVL